MSANTDRFKELCAIAKAAIEDIHPGSQAEMATVLFAAIKFSGDLLIELEELRAEKIRMDMFNETLAKGLGIVAGGSR